MSIAQAIGAELTWISPGVALAYLGPGTTVDIVGGAWHVLNFLAAALGIGFISSMAAKVLWHRELQRAPWWRMWAWASCAAAVISIAGLVVFGRDGKIATYGAMVLGCALALWWSGFRRARG